MALLTFENVKISGISACVPETIIDNSTISTVLTSKEAEKIIKTTGIKERRFAKEETCASDLCITAAEELFTNLNIDRDTIDILIFTTQTPDYKNVPATACTLQDRLGLSKNVGAFDMTLGCSGFIYALSVASGYVAGGANRVLLLVGETLSKFISIDDKSTGLLFGDAGVALLVERDESVSPVYFSLNTDGSGKEAIIIEGGGYRNPSSESTLKIKEFGEGSKRNLEQLKMKGMDVFDFTMREVVPDIRKILEYSNTKTEDIDDFIFHQANKFIIDMFRTKLSINKNQIPMSIDKFGNTSAVSIPLNIVSELKNEELHEKRLVLMSGYGAGLSWGSCLINLKKCHLGQIINKG